MTGETTETADDIKTMSFEQALKALEDIVDHLERGEALKAHCDKLLKAAEDKVEKIRLARDGKPTGVEPLDGE
jgi:exodeoxyribonuclease VII small subunit